MGAVAGRYARAFAEVGAEHKLDAATVVEELGEIAALVNGHAELRNVLENPAVGCSMPSSSAYAPESC
jgi:F-type H+-transporting ATPase subunit delta